MTVEFIKSVFNDKDFLKGDFPEFVFCGRSNVGKSSLINSLFNRKDLAKVSSIPGKTQSVNYYLIDNKYYLVDLPGYGYAKASKSSQMAWAKLIDKYFKQGKSIKGVFHLVDSRHAPTALDIDFQQYISQYSFERFIILTKIDKIKQSEISKSIKTTVITFPGYVHTKSLFTYTIEKPISKKDIFRSIENLL